MTSLAATHGWSFPGEVHLDHFRVRHVEGAARHRHGDVQPPRADRHHPDAAARGGVRVGAQHRLAGGAEPLDVDLMADAVPGAGVEDAVPGGDRLQVQVVGRAFSNPSCSVL